MIDIRLATAENEPAVRALIRQAIKNTPQYSPQVIAEELSYNSTDSLDDKISEGLCIIAVLDGEVCGTVVGENDCGVISINWIAVMPGYQRRGVGELLVEKFIDVVRGEGIRKRLGHKIICTSLLYNMGSTKLFKKMGFIQIALLDDYWHRLDFNLWQREV